MPTDPPDWQEEYDEPPTFAERLAVGLVRLILFALVGGGVMAFVWL